jgi:hypothetical protein
VAEAIRLGAAAVLFNCSQPEVMEAALDAANAVLQQQGKACNWACMPMPSRPRRKTPRPMPRWMKSVPT